MRLPLAAIGVLAVMLPALRRRFPSARQAARQSRDAEPARHARRHEDHHEGGLGSETPARAEGAVRALHVRSLSRRSPRRSPRRCCSRTPRRSAARARSARSRSPSARRSGRRSTCSSRSRTGKTPAACFVGPNFGGNHLRRRTTSASASRRSGCRTAIPAWRRTGPRPRAAASRPTPGRLQQIVEKGYAVATFYCGDIQPDRPNVREGMRATLPDSDRPTLGDETATIMWWAWGCHRAVDYLVTDKDIDAKRLAVVGHSRLGKTALLAGAFDDRIAVVIPHQSGCGGAGPSRSPQPEGRDGEADQHQLPALVLRELQGVQRRLDEAAVRPERPGGASARRGRC